MSLLSSRPSAVLIASLAVACRPSEAGKHQPVQSESIAALRPSAATFDSTRVSRVSPFDSADGSNLNDWLMVPGVRIGPVTARSTEAELKAIFGSDEVTRDSVFWFEGDYRPATVLFSGDSIHRLSIVWKDEEKWSNPERIELEGGHSMWHTAEGISLGTRLEELESLNGRPFRITSADHDYAGLAWSWENGALATKLKYIELWLGPRFYSEEHHPYSSDSTARAARASVRRFYAYFPE